MFPNKINKLCMCCCHGFFLHKCFEFCVRDFKGKMVGKQLGGVGCVQDELSVHAYEWHSPQGLWPRMTPSVTIQGKFMCY